MLEVLKEWIAKMLFQFKIWCIVEIFLAGVLVSFVKLMAYGDISIGNSFVPYCLTACCKCAPYSASIAVGCGRI